MATLAEIHSRLTCQPAAQYLTQAPINLYKSSSFNSLVTQAAPGRHLQVVDIAPASSADGHGVSVAVCLLEDDYPGWIESAALTHLQETPTPYQPTVLSQTAIQARLSAVIAFTQAAMKQPNCYLWGGTLGPDYDCSGLIQTAFASQGIRLPRDSYQQEAFVQPVALANLDAGDLLFFGLPRTNHVALYLGDGRYIHSSGIDQGRNGIGIDSIWDLSDPISSAYARSLRGGGRVVCSYQPSMLS